MLNWSLTILLVAILAALYGFSGITGLAPWMAKMLFFVFLILFVWSMLAGRRRV